MKDFAFFCTPPEVKFFSGIIKNIPKEILDIHIGTIAPGNDTFTGLADCMVKDIHKLMDAGYCVHPLDTEKLMEHRAVALSFLFFHPRFLDWRNKKSWPNLIYLMHDTSYFGLSWDLPPHFYIMASKGQALAPENDKVSKESDPEKFFQYMSLPKNMVNEFSYTGPWQLNEWCKNRNLSKEKLRDMLEQKICARLPENKPVIAFFLDEYCDRALVEEGFKKLVPYASIIVKGWGNFIMPDLPGAYRWPDRNYAPNLLRFGADYILAGYQSGTLSTSTMLGQKIIPYYTEKVHIHGNWLNDGSRSYTYFLPDQTPNPKVAAKLPTRIMDVLNPPLNLLDTEGILDRINSREWWNDYAARLPSVQKSIFGDYSIDDAPERTAGLIMKVFEKNSFGNDAAAVRIRPEYGNIIPDVQHK